MYRAVTSKEYERYALGLFEAAKRSGAQYYFLYIQYAEMTLRF